jgi:hypothetical protein
MARPPFKYTLILLLISVTGVTHGQTKKSKKEIESKVNDIYLENSVYVMTVQPIMNSDIEKSYKIKIHNGSKKQIVALNLWLNYNELSNNAFDGGNSKCYLSKKIKLSINKKSNKTYILNEQHDLLECDNTPRIDITTIVYSDGTFDEYKNGIDGFFKRNAEKDKIRKKLLLKAD